MRCFLVYLFLAAIMVSLPDEAVGQCKTFARRICKADLDNFMHDGNYHAAVLA